MKSIVLFLSFRSPLLFAASLSSGEIGTFFALPEWMPRSVSSHDTPGSDPEDGSGWYADEYTNGVRHVSGGHWRVYVDGEDFGREVYLRPGATTVNVMNIISLSIVSERLKPREFSSGSFAPYELPSPPPGETVFEWDQHVEGRAVVSRDPFRSEPFTDDFRVRLETDVDVTDRFPTGRRFPRAARLAPEIQASVYATFDGVCERMYYASQGQSNVWDTAEYGPRTARDFVFPRPISPYQAHLNPTNYYVYWPTNRTISTRRLVEYDNLMNLCGNVPVDQMDDQYFGIYIRRGDLGAFRPNWVTDDVESSPGFAGGRLYWSTTASPLPDVFVPEFDWRYGIKPVSNEWSGALATFGELHDVPGVWSTHLEYGIIYYFLRNVYFHQRGWSEDTAGMGWDNASRLTMAGLIETNYPSADGCAITNKTRRLFSGALCCANQFLGLADRTIHIPRFSYAEGGTNEQYITERNYRGEATFSLSKRPYEPSYDVSFGQIDWNDTAETNRTSGTTAKGGYGQIARRFSGTWTSAGATIAIKGGGGFFMPDDATAARVIGLASLDGVAFSPGEQVTISIDSYVADAPYVNLSVSKPASGSVWSHYGYSVMDDPTSTVARVFCNYTRSYSYVRTTGESTLYATQPGRDAGDRAGKTVAAAIVGVHNRPEYYTSSLWELPAHDDGDLPYSQYLYKTKRADPATRYDVLALMEFAAREGYNRFRRDLGFEPIANFDIIEIDDGDAEKVKRSVSLDGITTASISVICPLVYIRGIITGSGGIAVNAVLSETPLSHQYVPGYLPLFKVTFDGEPTHDEPSAYEIEAFSSDTRFSLVTRTDWDWKCLNRTDE